MLYNFLRGFYYRYVAPHLAQATLLGYAQTTVAFVAIGLGISLYIIGAHTVFMLTFDLISGPFSFNSLNDITTFFVALVLSVYAIVAYTLALYGLWHIKTIIGAVKKWVKEVVEYSSQH